MKLGKRLRKLLKKYKKAEGTDEKGAIRDLLTEVFHLCRKRGLDFDDRAYLAKLVADEEHSEATQ